MDKLTAIIVDDEANSRKVISELLCDHCPELELVGVAKSAVEARELVAQHHPDVVFLDIMMPQEDGFEFLDGYEDRSFSVIFITAYHEHAIRAIKASAADYLLKPVDVVELREAVNKVVEMYENPGNGLGRNFAFGAQAGILYDNLNAKGQFSRIILHRPRGIKVVDISNIIYIRSDAHYTTVRTVDEGDLIVTGSLKDYEEILGWAYFCRVHKSHLINLQHVAEYCYSSAGRICLSNDEKLIVSKRRTREFLSKLQDFVGLVGKLDTKK